MPTVGPGVSAELLHGHVSTHKELEAIPCVLTRPSGWGELDLYRIEVEESLLLLDDLTIWLRHGGYIVIVEDWNLGTPAEGGVELHPVDHRDHVVVLVFHKSFFESHLVPVSELVLQVFEVDGS